MWQARIPNLKTFWLIVAASKKVACVQKKTKEVIATKERRMTNGRCVECGRSDISKNRDPRINCMCDKCYKAFVNKLSGIKA